MKKTTFLAVMLCLTASVFAYEQIGQLNPYAYNVSAQERNGRIAVSYNLNAPAVKTSIVIYCDGVQVGTQEAEDNALGLHTAVVDLSTYTQGGKYTFGIKVEGKSVEEPTQLKEILDGSTDETALYYAFYHPKGVAIDRDPKSENFGRILTAEAMMDTPDADYHSSADKAGIYAFDATFAPIANGNNRAFKGGVDYAIRMQDGKTHAYAPYRIVISKDGRIFASMQDDRMSPLYELSADLQTWTPIFNGALADGVLLDADGNYVTGINCGLDVRGEGEDLEIIMLNANLNAFASYDGKDFMVATYKLGTAKQWTGAATTADTLANLVNIIGTDTAAVVPVAGNCGIAYASDGGFWYSGNRANAVGQRALVHVKEGKADWAISTNDSTLFGLNGNGLNGGGQVREIDGMLILGSGQTVTGTGRMLVLDVDYTDGVKLTAKYDTNLIGISRNLNDFAIDFGHNLYTVGNSNEKIVPVALPYSGTVETPIDLEVEKESTGLDNINASDNNVEKVFENGQVVIIKNGVRYNVLGVEL